MPSVSQQLQLIAPSTLKRALVVPVQMRDGICREATKARAQIMMRSMMISVTTLDDRVVTEMSNTTDPYRIQNAGVKRQVLHRCIDHKDVSA